MDIHEIILAAKLGRERKYAQVDTCTVFAAALYDLLTDRGVPCRDQTECRGAGRDRRGGRRRPGVPAGGLRSAGHPQREAAPGDRRRAVAVPAHPAAKGTPCFPRSPC